MKITWTEFASKNLKEIFEYFSQNANASVAHNIRKEILKSVSQLKQFPESGQIEPYLENLKQSHKHLVVRNYKVIYKTIEREIIITDIFDSRQDPSKLKDNKR